MDAVVKHRPLPQPPPATYPPVEVKASNGDLGHVTGEAACAWGGGAGGRGRGRAETMATDGLINPMSKWDKNSSCNSNPKCSNAKGAK